MSNDAFCWSISSVLAVGGLGSHHASNRFSCVRSYGEGTKIRNHFRVLICWGAWIYYFPDTANDFRQWWIALGVAFGSRKSLLAADQYYAPSFLEWMGWSYMWNIRFTRRIVMNDDMEDHHCYRREEKGEKMLPKSGTHYNSENET